jgi:hypothetical protein
MVRHLRILRHPIRLLAVAAATLALVLPLDARAEGPIANRQDLQDDRIDNGADGGQLTADEKAKLEKQQDAIGHARDKAIANDGKIRAGEARRLTRAQNEASKRIHKLKHDDDAATPPAQ